jgi:hypothetical protein
MKNLICKSCGSNSFHKEGNNYVCDYCKSVYLDESKSEKIVIRETAPLKPVKKKSHGCLFLIVLILLGMAASPIIKHFNGTNTSSTFSTDKPTKKLKNVKYAEVNLEKVTNQSPAADTYEIGGGSIDDVAGWSKKLYSQVVVATENLDDESQQYSYTGGMSYDDLVKIVGKPTSTTSYSASSANPARTMAYWNEDVDARYANADVTITYDDKTRMVINKSCYPE